MANNSLWILEELKKWLKEEIDFAGSTKEIDILESVSQRISELETE